MTAYELNSTAKANEALAAIGGTGFGTTSIQLLKQLVVAAGVYRGSQFVGPLDAFAADLSGVWSPTARLLTSYSGPLINVRRDSDDTTLDVGATSTGALDIAAASAFIGGGTGYITTIYDQSGTANDITQATTTNQPLIDDAVTAWDDLPAAVFSGNQFLELDTAISPTSMFMGVHSTSSTGLGRYCCAASGDSSMFELGVNSAFVRWNNADGQISVPFADQTIGHGLEMWYDGLDSIIRIDTAEEASAATAPLSSVYRVGAFAPATQGIIGSITYMVALDAFYDITARAAFRAALASVFPFAV